MIADLSSGLCLIAALAQCAGSRRRHASAHPQPASVPAQAAVLIGLALWTVAIAAYAHAPFAALRVRALLVMTCLAPAPWLSHALGLRERSLASAWSRWRGVLAVQAAVSVGAAATVWLHGTDWITGIGPEPAVVVTQAGLVATALAVLPGVVALLLLLVHAWRRLETSPALLAGDIGAVGSLLWVALALLVHGFLTPTLLVSAAALAGVAALFCAAGAARELSGAVTLVPSRRLVYGSVAVGLGVVYLVAAHVALGWLAVVARTLVPDILPAAAFVAVAALVVLGSSRRWRHRLWVTVGRRVFRSKHDYGEVWIRLTELVAAADTAAVLLQRTAAFCCEVLCVAETHVWLADPNGGLRRHATADGAAAAPAAGKGTGGRHGLHALVATDEAALARASEASFACPMLVNGRVLGVLALGSHTHPAALDDEDRRLMRYVAAQVGSALALYELGEELADSRELRSLHRLSTFILHDLKNLVAQQSFVLENARKFAGDARFVADALAAFDDSTNRMRALINRLRSQQPGTRAAATTCDLIELIRELLAKPKLVLRNGCQVQLQLRDDIDTCPVRADRTDLAQVFSNLLVNAVESLPLEDGAITVAVRPVASGWQVDVHDNGCGIPAGFLREHLFRPFRTTKEGGLGIGLYQCKTIIEASGGSISVSNGEHAGTTVSVTLPAAPPPAPAVKTKDVQYG